MLLNHYIVIFDIIMFCMFFFYQQTKKLKTHKNFINFNLNLKNMKIKKSLGKKEIKNGGGLFVKIKSTKILYNLNLKCDIY